MAEANKPDIYPELLEQYRQDHKVLTDLAKTDFLVFAAGLMCKACDLDIVGFQKSSLHELETYLLTAHDKRNTHLLALILENGEMVLTDWNIEDPELEGNQTVGEAQMRTLWERYKNRDD